MSWNHRVIRSVTPQGEEYFAVHEVFYEGEAVTGWTCDPVDVGGESLEDLRWTLDSMIKCLSKPVLQEHDDDTLVEAPDKNHLRFGDEGGREPE